MIWTRAQDPCGSDAWLLFSLGLLCLGGSWQVIKNDSSDAEAYGIRGMALFLSADYDQAMKHLKEGLRLDPDSR
jgi:tetratricopeptide (TPR) repeat protein